MRMVLDCPVLKHLQSRVLNIKITVEDLPLSADEISHLVSKIAQKTQIVLDLAVEEDSLAPNSPLLQLVIAYPENDDSSDLPHLFCIKSSTPHTEVLAPRADCDRVEMLFGDLPYNHLELISTKDLFERNTDVVKDHKTVIGHPSDPILPLSKQNVLSNPRKPRFLLKINASSLRIEN